MKLSHFLTIAWVVWPAIYWLVLRRRDPSVKSGCLTYIFGYLFLLATVQVVEAELWYEMMAYDIDGDGMVMGVERTPLAIAAEREWTSDVGRSYASFTGFFFVLIWYSFVILILTVAKTTIDWIVKIGNHTGSSSAG